MSVWGILKNAWTNRNRLGDKKLGDIERQFLPAALEIQETPPSPAGRIIGWSLITLFAIGVVWACIGKVDIVAVAEGKLVPSGQVKQVQPLEKGVVKTLYVTEGQVVKKGDPLIELDQTLTFADQQRLTQELQFTETGIRRQQELAVLLESSDINPGYSQLAKMLSDKGIVDRQQVAMLWQEWQSYQAKKQALIAEQQERSAEQQASKERITQLQGTLPLITKRVEAVKTLHAKNLAAEVTVLELEERRIQQAQALAAEQATQQQLAAAVQRVGKELQALQAEAISTTLANINEQQRQKQGLLQELNKAKDINAHQILHAPISGKVQQLAVHTVGGVVTPAQPLMLIVPTRANLEVEAWLENKDIGFVEIGQSAEIKIHTFPFTRYGVIDGEVVDVTPDAVANEAQQFLYRMRVAMKRSTIQIEQKEVNLISGMTVSAEVKTGKRRLIEFLMAPLLRYKNESVRER